MNERGPSGGIKRVKIHIRGQIDPDWKIWFEGLEVIPMEDGTTILQGPVADQSAVYGILARLRDLGLELLSVEQSE
jgi:hypothetical protein